MVKLIWRFALLVAAGLVFAWLADRPGSVDIQWLGRIIHVSVLVGVIFLATLFASGLFLWRAISRLWRSPKTLREYWRFRKTRKAYESLSQGIIAAGAGDATMAAKHAAIAGEILKDEPLVKLLSAQAAQLRGDKSAVKQAFETMTENKQTQLLGLRGLFAEARQNGDWQQARVIAERANGINARLPWAASAVLQAQLMSKDWAAAAKTISEQQRSGLLKREEAGKKQAAVLAADALALETENPSKALEQAQAAHALDGSLVPAALVAARVHIAGGYGKKAARILKSTWALTPHPELAATISRCFAGDTTEQRFERVRDLVGPSPTNLEGAYALARAAVDANRIDVAREALMPFTKARSQVRICSLMAEIEDASGDRGLTREWLARAIQAQPDPMWVSDGVASSKWVAVSPVSGELVPCLWKEPFEQLNERVLSFRADGDVPQLEAKAATKAPVISQVRLPDDPGID